MRDLPEPDCGFCPRLCEFRLQNRRQFPDWHNGPVPSFGDPGARLLIVGLAPGLRGANRTGRPFTGDYAGDLLYESLLRFGFATGDYRADPDDGLRLVDCRVTNAVRCVPPQNKPIGAEIGNCRMFLKGEMTDDPAPTTLLALGRIAHDTVVSALGVRKVDFPFAHGALHRMADGRILADSYHCSRYNTNTGVLTVAMFHDVISRLRELLG